MRCGKVDVPQFVGSRLIFFFLLRTFISHCCPKLILCSSINKPNSHDDLRAGQSTRVHVLLPSAAAKRAAIYDERLDFTTRIVAVFTGPYTAPRSRGYMLRFLRSLCTYAGKSRKTAEGTKRPTHIHRLYTSLRRMVSVPSNSSWMRHVSYACFEITYNILRWCFLTLRRSDELRSAFDFYFDSCCCPSSSSVGWSWLPTP